MPDTTKQKKRKTLVYIARILRHPLSGICLTFLFTVIGAGMFNKFLDTSSKSRELELAATHQAIDSLKNITDLLFERSFRANMVRRAIVRRAPEVEIRERKKAYDEVFVRYNATVQSNLFRIREMFRSASYTNFESLLEGPLRELLVAQDGCITKAFDQATSPLASDADPNDFFASCEADKKSYQYPTLYKSVNRCLNEYTNSIYRIVQRNIDNSVLITKMELDTRNACQLPPPDGKQFAVSDKKPKRRRENSLSISISVRIATD